MADPKKFRDESQDARRHSQQDATHPSEVRHNEADKNKDKKNKKK